MCILQNVVRTVNEKARRNAVPFSPLPRKDLKKITSNLQPRQSERKNEFAEQGQNHRKLGAFWQSRWVHIGNLNRPANRNRHALRKIATFKGGVSKPKLILFADKIFGIVDERIQSKVVCPFDSTKDSR